MFFSFIPYRMRSFEDFADRTHFTNSSANTLTVKETAKCSLFFFLLVAVERFWCVAAKNDKYFLK